MSCQIGCRRGRYLVGFCLGDASATPRVSVSAGVKKLNALGWDIHGWSPRQRQRVASQVEFIRHWRIIEGEYTDVPELEATWFIDPPYNNRPGRAYKHHAIDYVALGAWCQSRPGQVIVCENAGADWLPFVPFATLKAGPNKKAGSQEVIWTKEC